MEADRINLYRRAAEILRPEKVYTVLDLQDLIGVPAGDILLAAQAGDIARWLGEGKEMCLIGIDILDWLEGRKPWPCDAPGARHGFDDLPEPVPQPRGD
jgi:hypothetical protein